METNNWRMKNFAQHSLKNAFASLQPNVNVDMKAIKGIEKHVRSSKLPGRPAEASSVLDVYFVV